MEFNLHDDDDDDDDDDDNVGGNYNGNDDDVGINNDGGHDDEDGGDDIVNEQKVDNDNDDDDDESSHDNGQDSDSDDLGMKHDSDIEVETPHGNVEDDGICDDQDSASSGRQRIHETQRRDGWGWARGGDQDRPYSQCGPTDSGCHNTTNCCSLITSESGWTDSHLRYVEDGVNERPTEIRNSTNQHIRQSGTIPEDQVHQKR